jgi:HK97 family phage major capsid protein
MSKTRTSTLSPGVRAKLTDMGFAPWQVGRTFNNAAAGGAGTATAEPERITIPDSPAGLEEMLADTKKMRALFAQKDGFGDFVRSYAKNVLAQDQEIATQVRDETQRVLAAWLKDHREEGVAPINFNPAAATPGVGGSPRHGLHNPQAMGAQIDKEFANSAEYFKSIWHNTNRDASLQAKMHRVRNAFSSTVPSEGGFLIPETLRSEMLSVALETAVVRSRAFVVPMETLRVPFPSIDSTSNVDSVFGGIVAYWTEEAAALTESQATFGRVVLDAKKLTAMAHVPNELISDSLMSFQAFIDQKFPEALTFYEDLAFLKGSGVGEPLGALAAGNDATVQVAKEAGQPADSIVWENIVKMFARMLPSSLGRAVWVASIDTFPELATMALSVGTGGSAIWLNNGVQGPPMTILGRPVIFTEKAPGVLGDLGDLSFVDFGFYLVGDRQVMSAMSSPHYRFANDQTSFRIIQRVDGKPWLQSAITPQNGGPALSPFVQLDERA